MAGLGKGCDEGSGTRSALLWEVKRLLNEVSELPQILVMENVPQVHGKNNIDNFNKWLEFLSSKGYTNYWKDLNAKDYGVAQSRNRCFCVSLLGNHEPYVFEEPIPLTKKMKDYLEPSVEDKFYVTSDRAKQLIDRLVIDNKIPELQGGGGTGRHDLQQPTVSLASPTASQPDVTEEYQQCGKKATVLLSQNASELEKYVDV